MGETPIPTIFGAAAIWAPIMILPVLMMYFDSAPFKLFTLSLIYPLILSIIARRGRFWVARSAIAYSGIAAITVSYLISLNKKNIEAIKDPNKDKTRSALLFTALIFTFLMSMGMTCYFIEPCYSKANFS